MANRSQSTGMRQRNRRRPQRRFAGGCFWCTEAAFEQLDGVTDVESGYAGGTKETANYERVCDGDTGHAERFASRTIRRKISYDQLLDVFFDAHDPTQLNRQGNDIGTQYRSAIFYANEDERRQAEAKIRNSTRPAVPKANRHHARTAQGVLSRRGVSPRLRPQQSAAAVHPIARDAQGVQDSREAFEAD